MNTHPRVRRRRFVVAAATAAALLGAPALLTACGSSSSGGTAPASGQTPAADQARKFTQCIRDNGVPDFPDPDANGQFRGAGHELQGDPKFQAALKTCRSRLPGGGAHQGP